ncbi:MAG: hypothetical protein H6Q72_926 [Firmicutes bacterium]|nr:hypothetical protein [Bacillota bacterium]
MARARNIKPGFFSNENLVEIEPLGRLLFAGLWTLADREGRLEDRPKKIKMELLPCDDCNIEALLQELADKGFILRYKVNGVAYIQIINFSKHQNPHKNEKPSEIPAPELHGTSIVQAQCEDDTTPEKDVTTHADSLIPDSGFLTTDSQIPDNSFVPVSSGTDDEAPADPGQKGDKRPKYTYGPEHMELAEQLKCRILEHMPNYKYPSCLDQWANTIRLMIERDNRSLVAISAVIDWCQQDSFWQTNILSADNLREKFDRLQGKMTAVKTIGKQGNGSRLSMMENVKRRLASGS